MKTSTGAQSANVKTSEHQAFERSSQFGRDEGGAIYDVIADEDMVISSTGKQSADVKPSEYQGLNRPGPVGGDKGVAVYDVMLVYEDVTDSVEVDGYEMLDSPGIEAHGSDYESVMDPSR